MIRVVAILCLVATIAGADPVRPPSLGVSVELEPDPLSADAGLLVTAVRPGSNGARLGVQVGDRIVGVGEVAVVAAEDLRTALAAATVGEPFTLVVERGGERMDLAGELRRETGVRELADRAEALGEELARLQGGDPAQRPRYSLQELLVILRQIERDLPAAAAEFKRIYPEGRFRIGIHIDIDSHAPDEAVEAEVPPEEAPATP